MELSSVIGLLVATLGGAAIGLEREWSGHASGAHARFGGIRTFTLLGGLAGLAGWLSVNQLEALGVVLLGAAAGLVVVGYIAGSRTDIDGTTEVAALVVLAAGTLAGAGHIMPASAVVAIAALLLLEKTRLHRLVTRIDDASLRASVRFAAMACVILPLLPVGPYGPYGAVRPRELWALVLFFSGLSFMGWIARRLVGARQGVIVAGILGGVISSTSVTWRFAHDSRQEGAPRLALAAGAIAACTVMLLRVTLACAVLNPALALTLPVFLVPPFLVGGIAVLAAWRADVSPSAPETVTGSPLQLRSALQMTGLFQVVLVVILAVTSRWGSQALIATSAFVGLTDLDALTLSLARSASTAPDLSMVTLALVTGIVSNTMLKFTAAVVMGRGVFRLATGAALGAMAIVIVVVIALR